MASQATEDVNTHDEEQPIANPSKIIPGTVTKKAEAAQENTCNSAAFKNGLVVTTKAVGLGLILFLAVWGALAAGERTSSSRYYSDEKLQSTSGVMENALDAWAHGKTVVFGGAGKMVALSAAGGDGFWIINSTGDEADLSVTKTTYQFLSREHSLKAILTVECRGEGKKDGGCLVQDIQ